METPTTLPANPLLHHLTAHTPFVSSTLSLHNGWAVPTQPSSVYPPCPRLPLSQGCALRAAAAPVSGGAHREGDGVGAGRPKVRGQGTKGHRAEGRGEALGLFRAACGAFTWLSACLVGWLGGGCLVSWYVFCLMGFVVLLLCFALW